MKRLSTNNSIYAAASAALTVAFLAVGCSEDTTNPNPTPTPTPTPPNPPDPGGFGISSIKPAANDPSFKSPFDATPDPKGEFIYFTAITNDDEPGPAVFAVASSGGAVRLVHKGAPLASPFGIAITDDGQTLFVADGSADLDGAEDGPTGAVFKLATSGGPPTPVAGTAGLNPRGLEIQGDFIYFSGRKNGSAGVYKMGTAGAPTAIVEGAPLRDPAGVTVTKKGDVFVVDSFADDAAGAAVMRISPGKAEMFKDGLAVAMPAGLTTVGDDSALLVSGLDPDKRTDVVFRVELSDKGLKTFSDVIGAFTESSGLHRARNADVFAWADGRANDTGTVFFLKK